MPAHSDYTIWQTERESGAIGQRIMFLSVYSAKLGRADDQTMSQL